MGIKRGKELNREYCFVSLSLGEGSKFPVLRTRLVLMPCQAEEKKFAPWIAEFSNVSSSITKA